MRHAALLLLVLAASPSSSRAYFANNVTVNGVTVAGGLFHTSDAIVDGRVSSTESTEIGFGNYGQIGSGDNETLGDEEGEVDDGLAAVDLGDNTAQDVAAGQSHTCVVLTSGAVACFGFNGYGQLGLGDNITRGLSPSDMGENLTLVDLGTGRTATRIGSGYHHTCAVLNNGSLKCWGKNEQGMLGLGDTQNRGDSADEMGDNLPAVDLGTGRTAVSVAGGRFHTCALLDNATLKCWGGGNITGHNYGQLGQGNTFDLGSSEGQMGDALPAIDLGTDRTVVAFDVGDFHTCALLDNGGIKCFGRNFDGQLGLGNTEDRGNQSGEMGDDLPFVDLGADRYAVTLTCGRWHTCVILDNADVKCFGVNTSNNLGAGQLGLEDTDNRGQTEDTVGDNLEVVQLGTGQISGWIFAAFDHTCVIFDDAQVKCWGLNASGQLGLGHTDDVGAEEGTMGNSLTTVKPGWSRLAFPPSPAIAMNEVPSSSATTSASSDELVWYIILVVGLGALVLLVLSALIIYRWLRRRLQVGSRKGSSAPSTFVPDVNPQLRHQPTENIDISDVMATGSKIPPSLSTPKALAVSSLYGRHPTGLRSKAELTAIGPKVESREMVSEGFPRSRVPEAFPYPQQRSHHRPKQGSISQPEVTGSIPTARGMAAVGAAGVMITGGVYYGWEVVSRVAETLPWIGAAFCLLNDLVDIADAKFELEGNLGKMKGWALCLRDAILQISQQIEMRPSNNTNTLKYMSQDVISSLEELVETVTQWEKKGMLAQYMASRSCKRAVDAADAALRGALQRLTFGQASELMTMVRGLESAGLVVTEKLDMVFEQLRRQDENAARLELRLAEYSEAVAEVLGLYMRDKGQATSSGKTLRELGKEALDRLQISSADITYPSNVPFAAGTFSEVYQVIHKGTIKVAKKTNLSRFGLRTEDTDRVFGRFVKELYILSRMRSDRVVTVHGAVATPTELTIIMEFVERGCLRAILDDDVQREAMTPTIKYGLLMDTAEGMNYLYNAGVEHRDLKSANCLVTHDWRIKISDFGLSNTTDAISTGSVSHMGSFRGGTLLYLAPELLVGGSGVFRNVPAELSDVYSFGVIVWEVICGNGELPWANLSTTSLIMVLRRGERLKIRDGCSEFYRTLMNDCWAHDPNRRPTFKTLVNILKGEKPRAGAVQLWPVVHSRPTVKATRSSALDLHSSAVEERGTISTSLVDQMNIPRPSTGERPPPPPYRDIGGFQARLGKS